MDSQIKFHKKFLSSEKPLKIVGAYDGLGAKLIERHGFDGVWASSFGISASHCLPDANILTMTQCLERIQEMCITTHLPVIADVDTGYGNFNNVRHMINLYENLGVTAIIMEDKIFPKINSFALNNQKLASIPEFCGKLQAAQDARKNKNGMLIIARIEALIAGCGLNEALRRAKAYMEAGADGILIHSKSKEPDEIYQFLRSWNKQSAVILIPTTYPQMTYDDMCRLGVNMIIYANQCLRASVFAVNRVLEVIHREKSTINIEQIISPIKEIFDLQGMDILKAHEQQFNRIVKKLTKQSPRLPFVKS